jgi:hypothetical protein
MTYKKILNVIFILILVVGIVGISACKCPFCPDDSEEDENKRHIASTGLVTVMTNQPGLCRSTGHFSL